MLSRPFRRSMACAALLASLPACAGEEGEGSGAPRSSVRDSSGVTIVENDRPRSSHGLGWTVAPEPSVSIGTLDGDEEYQLFRVLDALVMADGRIAVANRGTSEVRLYAPSGRYLEAWGTEGEGPGEFTGLSLLERWPGDSLLAWDFRQRRGTVFSSSGEVGRTFVLDADEEIGLPDLVAAYPDGSLLIRGSVVFGDDVPTGFQRFPRGYAVADPSGAITASLGSFLGAGRYMIVTPDFTSIMIHPFARTTATAVWGDLALISPSDRYELNAFDRSGALRRSVRREHTLEVVTDEDMDAWIAWRLDQVAEDRRDQTRQQYAGMPPVETFPAFAEARVDALDHLWVREYRTPPDPSWEWTVFDPGGRVLGLIETPRGLDVLEIGEDYLLGTVTDEYEVEYVQLWRLTR